MAQRSLETLIEQFNRASEIDRVSRIATGEANWIEVDGVRTKMVDTWAAELSHEERADFDAHVAKLVREAAHRLGYESSEAWFYDIGQKMFEGMVSGIATYPKWLPTWARPIVWHFRNFKYKVTRLVHSP